MIINLKQIRLIDTDNIKLDKINYNFDQLIVNGGGPRGYVGPDGNTGPQGFQGALGFQGDRGTQGVQGPIATSEDSYWAVVPQNLVAETNTNIMATMFSKHPIDILNPTPSYPSIVASGYISGDNGYESQQSNTSGLPKYQWVVNRRSNKVASNLRFTSGDIFGNAFDITMDNSSGSLHELYLGFIDNQNSQLNLQAQEHIIKDSDGSGDPLFSASTIDGNTYNDTFFEKPVTFNAALKIENAGADINKIVTATGISGDVTFKTPEELGGSVKIGTIISILPSFIKDASRFVEYQSIDTNLDLNNPIKIRVGAGVGNYTGWYVCNGQEWTDGTIGGTTLVPDLNSFSYQIISNPMSSDANSQGYINVNNTEIQLIGGAPIFVDANEVGVSSVQYDINLTDNSSDPEFSTNVTGVQFKIKKLPQIVYLGVSNLWWSQLGTGQLTAADYNQSDYSVLDYDAS